MLTTLRVLTPILLMAGSALAAILGFLMVAHDETIPGLMFALAALAMACLAGLTVYLDARED